MSLTKSILSASLLLLLTLASACGGGGGGSTPPAPATYTVTFTAGTGGTLTGTATQTITSGGSTSAVTAVANAGYTFTNWTGSGFTTSTTAALTVTNVTANLNLTANFTLVPATTLAYTDPTTGTFQLKKNATLSTATHLVLDLVGPAATTGSGVSAAFTVDTAKVAWANVATADAAGTYVQNGTALTLGTAPQVLKGKVAAGVLQVTAAQKGTGNPVALNAPLVRVALDLKTLQAPGSITLSANAGKAYYTDAAGNLIATTVTVGTLAAQ